MSESKHRDRRGKNHKFKRAFTQEQINAGYADTVWGEHSTPDNALHGSYEGTGGVEIEVRHLDKGPTGGPEFEVEISDGQKMTCLDEAGVEFYLAQFGVGAVIL